MAKAQRTTRAVALASGIATLALFASCGDEVTKNNVTNVYETGTSTVSTITEATPCDTSLIGTTVYSIAEAALYVCNGSEWASMKGEDGAKGGSCSARTIAQGIEITCGETVIDTLESVKGDSGTSCTGRKVAQGVEITCGGEIIDTLRHGEDGEGCYTEKTTDELGATKITITCGDRSDTTTVWLCGDKNFDAATHLCDVRDSQIYAYDTVGGLILMTQNLNYVYRKGNEIYGNKCADNDPKNCEKHGRQYTWAAAMDSAALFSRDGEDCGYGTMHCSPPYPVRGVCPAGWYLPNDYVLYSLASAVDRMNIAGEDAGFWSATYGEGQHMLRLAYALSVSCSTQVANFQAADVRSHLSVRCTKGYW